MSDFLPITNRESYWFRCPPSLLELLEKGQPVKIARREQLSVRKFSKADTSFADTMCETVEFRPYRDMNRKLLGVEIHCPPTLTPDFMGLGRYVFWKETVWVSENGILHGGNWYEMR